MDTLVDRDGDLFVLNEEPSYADPILIRSWFPTGVRTYRAVQNYGDEILGQELTRDRDGVYRFADQRTKQLPGIGFQLKEGVRTIAEHHDRVPLKLPRGKRVYWHSGSWWKFTKKGEERIGGWEI